jgi:hypothetical protein
MSPLWRKFLRLLKVSEEGVNAWRENTVIPFLPQLISIVSEILIRTCTGLLIKLIPKTAQRKELGTAKALLK